MTFGCSVCGISSIGGTSGWTLVMAFLGMGDLGSDFLGVANKQGTTKNKHTFDKPTKQTKKHRFPKYVMSGKINIPAPSKPRRLG